MALKPIQIIIGAKDEASRVFDGLKGKIAAVGAAIAGYFGIKAFAGVVQGAAEFQAAMSRVEAATGASAEEMARLRQAAQDAGDTTKFTSTEAAGALENLAKAGLDTTQSLDALPAVINLAQAADVGLAESAEFVTKAVMGMGLQFADAARVADVLALGANATNSSVTGLAQALSYAAPAAQSANLSLESTVAIMGKLADAGIDSSRSGTAVANMLAQFSDPASQFKRALADAGITTNNFEEALHQLAAAGPRGEKAILAVGLNAGPALRALLNQGMGALDELKVKLQGAEGSAAATAKVMQDNLQGAMGTLANVWRNVTDVLATPVLPVLQAGVEKLSAAFRAAVADGTVAKFGQTIAETMRAGIDGVTKFIATIDVQAVITRLQQWGEGFAQTMAQIGQYATNAGNAVQMAWGVMTAGANGVLTAIYGIGSVFAETANYVMQGVAKLRDGLATVTFGGLSESFKLAAEDARNMAQGFGEAAQAMRDKATKAMQDMAAGAQLARDGFVGLAGGMDESTRSAIALKTALEQESAALQQVAENILAATSAQQKKTEADQAAKQAAADNAAAVAALRKEYADLIASGNLQAAAEKLGEINQRLRDTSGAGQSAQDALKQVEAAFGRLGITSAAVLKEQATNAQRDYELIRDSGMATAEDIQQAFAKAAQAAIDANKGIAPTWVQAQAGVRGYVVETDAAGKSVLRLADATAAAAGVTAAAAGQMQGHWRGVRDSIDGATSALQRWERTRYDKVGGDKQNVFDPNRTATTGEKLAPGIEETTSGHFRDRGKNSTDAKGNIQQQFVWTRASVIDFLKQSGLDELLAQDVAKQFLGPNGIAPYWASDAQKRWGGQGGSLSTALANVADYYKNTDNGKFEAAQRTQYLQQVEAFNQMTQLLQSQRQPAPPTAAPTGGSNKGSSSGTSSGITINVNGINDPVALARKLEPELRRLGALAR